MAKPRSATTKPKEKTKPRPKATTRPAAGRRGSRADLGAPIDGFLARQPPNLRAVLDELRRLIREAAPTATAALKWGMPWFSVAGRMMCALTAHKAHVNLILVGPAEAFADPHGLLAGEGGGRHLRLTAVDELPAADVRRWLRAAARLAGA